MIDERPREKVGSGFIDPFYPGKSTELRGAVSRLLAATASVRYVILAYLTCKRHALDANAKPATSAGLVIDGVTSVFKRFFNDECELQVLLSDDFASSLWVRPLLSVFLARILTPEKRCHAGTQD